METKLVNSVIQEKKEYSIQTRKARFEREMTEVLLNFREECLYLSHKNSSIGRSCCGVSDLVSALPDYLATGTVAPAEVKKSNIEFRKIDLPEITMIDQIDVETPSITMGSPIVTQCSYKQSQVRCEKIAISPISPKYKELEQPHVKRVTLESIPKVNVMEVSIKKKVITVSKIIEKGFQLDDMKIVRPSIKVGSKKVVRESLPRPINIDFTASTINVEKINVANVIVTQKNFRRPVVSSVSDNIVGLDLLGKNSVKLHIPATNGLDIVVSLPDEFQKAVTNLLGQCALLDSNTTTNLYQVGREKVKVPEQIISTFTGLPTISFEKRNMVKLNVKIPSMPSTN